jgi:thimet oligopeptidase
MTEKEGKREKMENTKKTRGIIAFTGTAAVLAIAANLVISAIKHKKEKNATKKGTPSNFFHFMHSRFVNAETVKN